jgi:uncharacterized protein (DUF983 family)
MSKTNPPAIDAGLTEKRTALEHDVVETIHAGREHVARCPSCGRETLWCEREFLTHADGCEVSG